MAPNNSGSDRSGRFLKVALAFGILSVAALSAATAPKLLIVQLADPGKDGVGSNFHLATLIAAQFDELGKVDSIVYSLTDSVFRTAVLNGRLKPLDRPHFDDAIAAEKALEADYLLTVEPSMQKGKYRAVTHLYKGTQQIWKDDQNISIILSESADPDDSARSLASTLVGRMNQEPLRGLAAKQTIPTAPLDQGQTPVTTPPPPPPTVPGKADHSALIKQAEDWIAAGKSVQAISALRDGVDADPLDAGLRTELINALLISKPELAASEARAAATLIPENVGLRILAARAWMRCDRPDEAQKDLNEAVARNPDALETRLMLAEVSMTQHQPRAAMEHLDKATSVKDTPEGRFLRALCQAMLGSDSGSQQELASMSKLEPTPEPSAIASRFSTATTILDHAFGVDSVEARNLTEQAIVKPDDKQVIESVSKMLSAATAEANFAASLQTPSPEAKPQQKRVLALRLLAQALSGVRTFLAGGGSDALSGSRIDLAEAIRNFQAIKS